MVDCFHPDCAWPATHWLVRYVPDGYLPNPDVRGYCDGHRVIDLRDAARALAPTPVTRIEIIDIVSAE